MRASGLTHTPPAKLHTKYEANAAALCNPRTEGVAPGEDLGW